MKDISQEKKTSQLLERSEKKFASAVKYSSIGLAIVALNGSWISVNPALCRILGYAEEEMLKIDFQTITHPDDLNADLQKVAELIRGDIETYEMEKRYFHKDGTIVWAQLNVSLVRGEVGEALYFISQIQNITKRKQLTRSLAKKTEMLELTNRELSDFAYNLSHDIKEKIRAILYHGSLLLQKKEHLPREVVGWINEVNNSAKDLGKMSDVFLEMSKTIDSPLKLSSSSIESLIRSIIEARYSRDDVNVEIKGEFPTLLCDEEQIRFVFERLIRNAVLYNESPVKTVCISVLKSDFDEYEFTIEDNGVGIKLWQKEKLFRLFKRIRKDEKVSGGYGLALVRKILTRHGGSIWLDSSVEGVGSVFKFKIIQMRDENEKTENRQLYGSALEPQESEGRG